MGGAESTFDSIERSDLRWISELKKSHTFVWCDAAIGFPVNKDDDTHTLIHLTRTVRRCRQLVHTFNDQNLCETFIKQANNVCLITSGAMGKEFVPIIHSYKQVKSIYIFCLRKSQHELWSSNYKKVRAVETQIKAICQRIKNDLLSEIPIDFQQLSFDVVPSNEENSNRTSQNLILVYSQMLKNILTSKNFEENGVQSMIKYLRNEFNEEDQIDLIDDLSRDYSSEKVFVHLTRDYFLQGIINRAFQQRNLSVLCSMQRMILDIEQKLENLQRNSDSGEDFLHLYFGHSLSREDIQRLKSNENGLLSIDQYIFANSEQIIPKMFIEANLNKNRNEKKRLVLFEISIEKSLPTIVNFGRIGALTEFVHENEFLISFGSIFRIERIEKFYEIPSALLVKIRLLTKNEVEQQVLLRSNIERVDLHCFGRKLNERATFFKSTEKFLRKSLTAEGQIFRNLTLHFNMALILSSFDENEEALQELRFALSIGKFHIRDVHQNGQPTFVPFLLLMSIIHQQAKRHNAALENAFRALRIATVHTKTVLEKDLNGNVFEILASISAEQGNLVEAKEFFEQALLIRRSYLTSDHEKIDVLNKQIAALENPNNF